ncbi:hypothetical protein IF1G_03460 [Cordyceps javanica]|uniref:Uncharacterized protein n=1 Tax=Cordyceps javanica TaxID=43265 RepID=A0A545V7L6_9HYPO|nr:hypothetical protein IF1G_03460 [Cordyceps javanica]
MSPFWLSIQPSSPYRAYFGNWKVRGTSKFDIHKDIPTQYQYGSSVSSPIRVILTRESENHCDQAQTEQRMITSSLYGYHKSPCPNAGHTRKEINLSDELPVYGSPNSLTSHAAISFTLI